MLSKRGSLIWTNALGPVSLAHCFWGLCFLLFDPKQDQILTVQYCNEARYFLEGVSRQKMLDLRTHSVYPTASYRMGQTRHSVMCLRP